MAEFKLDYTANEVNEKLGKIDNLVATVNGVAPDANGNIAIDSIAGEDGISATHSWNGTVLTITSASGTSSADLKGDKGADGAQGPQGEPGTAGYSPVRGIDYWTETDKAEIKSYVDEAILNGEW